MKKLLTLILALGFSLVGMAQEDPSSAAFEALVVSNVRLRLDEASGVSLVFNASPAVCEDLVVETSIDNNVIDVDAYVPFSPEASTCNFIAPYEPVIELGQLEADTAYTIFLNGFASQFFLPAIEGAATDAPFAVVWGEDNALVPFMRVDSYIDTVNFSVSENDTVLLDVAGSHPDGCEAETGSWVYADVIDTTVHHAEVFRLMPEGVICPAVLLNYDLQIDTQIPVDSPFYLEIGGLWFSYSPEETVMINRLHLQIDSVVVSPNNSGYEVFVTGSLPDCGLDLSSAEAATENASFIELGLYLPLDASCTDAETPYEGLFNITVLPVIVNGVAYTQNGVLGAAAQGLRPAPVDGGNGMPVDTVVESVDVLILESFPMQLDLIVKGYQPDGCDFPVIVEQLREENVVTVHIYREVPADVMCTMMLIPYEATIRLDGGFEGGTVEIHVNEFTTSVDL